jgi:hypothetical protein
MMREKIMISDNPQRGLNLDYIMWLLPHQWISLWLLGLVGGGGDVMGAHRNGPPTLMRWTFFPNPNHVVNSDIPEMGIWALLAGDAGSWLSFWLPRFE